MAANYSVCMKCGRPLVHDEIALHRKIVNRGAEEFMCLSCLSAYFKVSEEDLKIKIAQFKNQGCTLFFI